MSNVYGLHAYAADYLAGYTLTLGNMKMNRQNFPFWVLIVTPLFQRPSWHPLFLPHTRLRFAMRW